MSFLVWVTSPLVILLMYLSVSHSLHFKEGEIKFQGK